MSSLFNLNLGEYNTKELEDLFSLNYPYTKEDISVCGQQMKSELLKDQSLLEKEKEKVNNFIEMASEKLKAKTIRNILNPGLKKSKIIESGGHMIIQKAQTLLNDPNRRGILNPITTGVWDKRKKLIKRTINIDSLFRPNYYNTEASDFHFTMPMVLKDVIQMRLVACELPHSIYSISSALGNNFFRIRWDAASGGADASGVAVITIPDGNYNNESMNYGYCDCSAAVPNQIIYELNFQLSRSPPNGTNGLIIATLDVRTGKIIIAKSTLTGAAPINNINLFFNLDLCGNIIETPIQLNLGWILGYRFAEYTGNTAYITEGVYDLRGPKYLYLIVNDYNNNHTESIIGTFTDSLTVPENILARLSWKQYAFFSTTNSPLDETLRERNYFGPVDIQKLHIQLIDQFGRTISLNNMDWALALEFSSLYKV